eukprot:238760_1
MPDRKTDSDDEILQKCTQIIADVSLAEALIESTIKHRDDDKTCFIKHIPTLQQLMEKHMASVHKILIILTFDFESKLQRNSEYLEQTTIQNMDQFAKADEFERYIDDHLLHKDGCNRLLLQYRHKSNGMNHFIHIKYLIERAMYLTHNTHNKKIMILVHLRRSDTLSNDFPMIISAASDTVFLDSLSQKEPMDLKSFVSTTLTEMCAERGMDLLHKTFQRALSHLKFTNTIDIEYEVQMLNEILSNHTNPLQRCIFDRFIRLLSNDNVNRNIADIAVHSIRKIDNKNWNRGSFYERLNDIVDRVSIVAMIRILQTLYENDNIHTVIQKKNSNRDHDNKEILKLFLTLYSKCDFIVDHPLKQNIDAIIAHRPHKLNVNRQYVAQFPFSNTIYEYCNSLKSQIQTDETEDEKRMEIDDDEKYEIVQFQTPDVAQNMRTNSQNLAHEIQSVIPQLVHDVNIEMLQLYAQDM